MQGHRTSGVESPSLLPSNTSIFCVSRAATKQDLHAYLPESYKLTSNGFGHGSYPDSLSNTLLSQGWILKTAPPAGMVGGMHIPRIGKRVRRLPLSKSSSQHGGILSMTSRRQLQHLLPSSSFHCDFTLPLCESSSSCKGMAHSSHKCKADAKWQWVPKQESSKCGISVLTNRWEGC